jgi:hypothetical protein
LAVTVNGAAGAGSAARAAAVNRLAASTAAAMDTVTYFMRAMLDARGPRSM